MPLLSHRQHPKIDALRNGARPAFREGGGQSRRRKHGPRKIAARADVLLFDVRTHAEFNEARIEGAKHIPLGTLRGRLGELPRDKEIVTFSRVSMSAYEAAIILKANGFRDVRVLDGGLVMWPSVQAGQ